MLQEVDDNDVETQVCTCQPDECGDGRRKYAYDCGGQRWGFCNTTKNNFQPDDLGADDPLVALNRNWYSWPNCYAYSTDAPSSAPSLAPSEAPSMG